MTPFKSCDDLLRWVTPENMEHLLGKLIEEDPDKGASGISLPTIVDALTEGMDLGSPAEAWSTQLKLKQAIMAAVAQLPGMTYVEGDS